MFSTRGVFFLALLLAAVLVLACDHRSPSAPSPPPPSPAPDLSPLLGTWNLTVRVTGVTGEGCAVEGMQSHVGVLNRYALSIKQASSKTVDVILSSDSGDYSCSFTNVPAGSSGFGTFGPWGHLVSCVGRLVPSDFRCGDTTLDVIPWHADISASISGAEISGQWAVSFGDGPPYLETTWAEARAEFSGSR